MGLELKKLIDDLEKFDPEAVLNDIVEKNLNTISELQRDQWMEGRGVDGEFIRPYYSENPYFKSPESAARYAGWKKRITPNPQRPDDVPNLYITGYLHELTFAEMISDDTFDMMTDAYFGDEVFDTHKNAIGLSPEKRLLFAETITVPKFAEALKAQTGLML